MQTLIFVIVFLAAALFLSGILLNSLVIKKLQAIIPEITGTVFNLKKSAILPFIGGGALTGLQLGNPTGYQAPWSLMLEKVQVNLNLRSLFSPKIIIRKIEIQSPALQHEMKGLENNFARITQNIRAYSREKKGTGEKPQTEKKKSNRSIQIDSLEISGTTLGFYLNGLPAGTASIPLPAVHLKNIGKDRETTIAQALEEVFTLVNQDVTKLAANAPGKIMEKGLNTAQKGAQAAKDLFKGI